MREWSPKRGYFIVYQVGSWHGLAVGDEGVMSKMLVTQMEFHCIVFWYLEDRILMEWKWSSPGLRYSEKSNILVPCDMKLISLHIYVYIYTQSNSYVLNCSSHTQFPLFIIKLSLIYISIQWWQQIHISYRPHTIIYHIMPTSGAYWKIVFFILNTF